MNHRSLRIICLYVVVAICSMDATARAQSYDAHELDKLLSTSQTLTQGSSNLAAPDTGVTHRFDSLNSLSNFHVVTPGLLRGGQPNVFDLQKLKAAGVKTIVDLRNEDVIVREEAVAAQRLGLNFVSIPLDVFNPPPERAIQQFLRIATNSAAQPVYVHCLHGQDRTGTMVAIYRIDKQGWSGDQAYSEMASCGFRAGFGRLSEAVFAHARAAGRPGTPPSGGDIIVDIKNRLHRNKQTNN